MTTLALIFITFCMKKQMEFRRNENRCIKADASRRCRVSQVPLFYRPGSVAGSFSMPLYRPFPTQPSSPFSRSRPVCLFLFADGCPYFSLYPLRTQSPSRLEVPLLFLLLFFSSVQLSISSSRISLLLSLLLLSPTTHFTSFGHSCFISSSRTNAAARCNVIFIIPFSLFSFPFSIFLPPFFSIFSRHFLDKSSAIMKSSSVDDGFLLPVLLDPCWLDVVRCLDVTS